MKKSAFTLIELLVVISIIAILASLAIPAFSKVMEKARSVQDTNNLKQLGIGIIGYANDNSDSYPAISGTSWALLLNGTSGTVYVPMWKVFQSPFDSRPPSEAGGAVSPVSYSFNNYLTGLGPSDVASPSNCLMLAVYSTSYAAGPALTFSATDPHANSASAGLSNSSLQVTNNVGTFNGGIWLNVLYTDSHVASVKATVLSGSAVSSGTINNIIWNH